MVTANVNAGIDRHQAVEKAVDDAIKEKLLGDFFKINRAEVIGMFMTEFDEELAIHTWREDGRTEGRAEKAIEAARNFYANGASIELIAKSLNMTSDEVKEIVKDTVPVKAI